MSTVVSDLLEVWQKFKAMPPILVAVWCVDRPDVLGRIRQMVRTEAPSGGISFAAQVPVYEWYLRFATPDDLARRPPYFFMPGVYLQMSSGEYRRLTHGSWTESE